MRLISQNGMTDVPYEQCLINVKIHQHSSVIFVYFGRFECSLGEYSTEAKAREVMRQVREYAKRHVDIYILPDDDNELLNKLIEGRIQQ